MKATKIFMMAALALTFAACSNDDNDLAQQPAEQPANDEITITATVSSDDATTRALSPDGSNIASTWETTDQFAILFNDGSSNVKRIATVVAPISGSTVTITFTIPASLASDTPCTIVYPASAANAANTGADVATALATQDGTIGNCPEVRVGTATIDKDNHNLAGVTKLVAQNAIFKFTVKNADGSATIDVKPFIVSIDTYDYIVTPATAKNELFVALPAISDKEVKFTAFDAGSNIYMNAKADISFTAGSYYQSVVKLNTSSLKALIIPKGTSALKGDKLLFYQTGDTYQQAADRSENKNGTLGWGTWSNHFDQSTMFYRENGGAQADLSIDGNQQFGGDGLNNPINPSLNFSFVGTY